MTSLKSRVVLFFHILSSFPPLPPSFNLFPSLSSFVIGSHTVYTILEFSVVKDYFEFFNSLNYI